MFMTSLRHSFRKDGDCYAHRDFRFQRSDKFYTYTMQDRGARSSILVSQPFHSSSVSQPQTCPFQLKLRTINSHPYFLKINSLYGNKSLIISDIMAGTRQIRPKMITKVLTWLEKLCKETLKFSTQTFQRTARILLQFLAVVDEPVCNLQLVGCACLYLSSKISQSTVIAAQSYAECSCNIFTKDDLMKKESQIYQTIGAKTDPNLLFDIYQFIREETHFQKMISDTQDQDIKKMISSCLKDIECLTHDKIHLLMTLLKHILFLNGQDKFKKLKFFQQKMIQILKIKHSIFLFYSNYIKEEKNNKMKFSQSQKFLRYNQKIKISFYKNLKLKTIDQNPRMKNQQKCIIIEKTPWNKAISSHQIGNLLKRLNDTPTTLYQAFQRKKNIGKFETNKNKFKPLTNLSMRQKQNYSIRSLSLNKNTKQKIKQFDKKNDLQRQERILRKIRANKKKYVEQYRKMLLGMKAINLDTDLPRIKYVQQNQVTNSINQMNASSKLRLLR